MDNSKLYTAVNCPYCGAKGLRKDEKFYGDIESADCFDCGLILENRVSRSGKKWTNEITPCVTQAYLWFGDDEYMRDWVDQESHVLDYLTEVNK